MRTVRIKTSRTLRSIDSWKLNLMVRNHRYVGGLSILLYAFRYASRQSFIVAIFILALSLHFAAIQFGSLVLLGFFTMKLLFYRLANNIFVRLGGSPSTI